MVLEVSRGIERVEGDALVKGMTGRLTVQERVAIEWRIERMQSPLDTYAD